MASDVQVLSHCKAAEFLDEYPKEWDVICVVNSTSYHTPYDIQRNSKRMLELTFDDIDSPLPPFSMPSTYDVRAALEFARKSPKLVVTCPGGMSRSAALGYVIMAERMGPFNAISQFIPLQHHPNRLIITLAEQINKDSNLFLYYTKWLQKPFFNFGKNV